MARTYPKYWAGVAVHNNDPMTVAVYDNWLRTFPGFSGYPSIINDRNQLTDPLTVEADFYDHIVVPTPVILTNGAKYDSTKRELEVSVKGDFIDDISGDYRFNLVVIENNIQFLVRDTDNPTPMLATPEDGWADSKTSKPGTSQSHKV